MWNGAYFVIIVAVAVWSVFSGYRMGIMRQGGTVIGIAFGIVAARLLAQAAIEVVNGWIPSFIQGFNRPILCETLTSGGIFLIGYSFISLCGSPLGKLLSVIRIGIIGSLCGALFRLFEFMIIVSILYNIIAAIAPASDLTRMSSRHDGNIVEGVMMIAPPILGFPGAEEVAFRQQMEDARKIS